MGGWILDRLQDAQPEQIEVGASIHGSFDELESMNLPFNGAIAPGLLKSGEESGFIAA